MIEGIRERNKLQDVLDKYDDKQLMTLYRAVFETDSGMLVLQDLMNRCYMYAPTASDRDEGMRCVILTIQSLLSGTYKESANV